MGKMFKSVTATWNPATGCEHGCIYCYARILAEGRLRNLDRYKDGFEAVKLHEKEFIRTFQPGELVFVVDMGDLFGSWVKEAWIQRVIQHINQFPLTDFLFLTKNPMRYRGFTFPSNAILGVTLETDDYNYQEITKAPSPLERYRDFVDISHPRKFVSIEPIMEIQDVHRFLEWMRFIKPELIEVGADNYGFKLPEPSPRQLEYLLGKLREICPKVVEKDGLDRLHGEKRINK